MGSTICARIAVAAQSNAAKTIFFVLVWVVSIKTPLL
jgi:hypothetical protein